VRGRYGGRIWRGPEDQLTGLRAIACEELVAFSLMGTHFHLVLEVEDESEAAAIVRRITNRLDRTADERGVARLDTPHFQVLSDDYAVLRYVAYAHANPVKAGMVEDPLAWSFSSHRDVYGLRCTTWFSPRRILARLTERLDGAWLHRKAEGLAAVPAIVEPVPREQPVDALDVIAQSVASVHGFETVHANRTARRTFASVARLEGWHTRAIAVHLGRSDRQTRRLGAVDTPAVRAVCAVLRDPRLRPTGSAWWQVPAEARGPNLWAEWRESRA
jgi:hypothetical protein